MAKLNGHQIKAYALTVLANYPNGIRWSELKRQIVEAQPETPANTIHGNLHRLLTDSHDVQKLGKGLYALKGSATENTNALDEGLAAFPDAVAALAFRESDFYQSFADWLIEEVGDANRARALGGSIFKAKWGTPDIIGVLRAEPSDLIKFSSEIVSVELKIDTVATVTAFGQAVAYKLFSHKPYVAVPNTIAADDLSRLDALSAIYGIGVVTFTLDPKEPNYTLRVRAALSQPDMFYVNDMAKRLLASDKAAFDSLF